MRYFKPTLTPGYETRAESAVIRRDDAWDGIEVRSTQRETKWKRSRQAGVRGGCNDLATEDDTDPLDKEYRVRICLHYQETD